MPQRDARLIGGIYRIGQVVTSGGMLTTYTAYNHNTNDVVGLSVIEIPTTEQLAIIPKLLEPYEQRKQVHSPHVIRVLDWGLDGARLYIATDPPRGITLQHVLDNENIESVRAVELCRQIVLGLKALHEQGVAGMDLRPQLITVDTLGIQDRVQIDDIGLRSLLHALHYSEQQKTSDIGYVDPRYAPPEYIKNEPRSPRSDLYQAGLLLFTLTTGRLPFVGRTAAETSMLQITNPVPAMRRFKHTAPDALQAIVEYTMAKEPGHRFASASALLTALETIQQQPILQPSGPMISIREQESPVETKPGNTASMSAAEIKATLSTTLIEGKGTTPTLPSLAEIPTNNGIYAYLYSGSPNAEVQDETQRILITQTNVIIGRTDPKRGVSPDIDLSHIDPKMTISRQHARIRFEGTFFYIEDLKSRNKTRLRGQVLTPLKPELLRHGDLLSFGSVRLRFEIPGMNA